ncbi:hypothetical protein EJ08DRAFT_731054 [Tothia fuscella]|uniref:Uncharacterized protein n=1 Tax=Tothia fuscella TaxID=1048955 RepID=A0A9P4U2E9_9PEZI|nr:hypothetical protein EJ08DRAFT_731054 [Tothia fuscella]
MSTSHHVFNGLFSTWHDYDRPLLMRNQILVTQQVSKYLTNFLAILIALTVPSLFIIIVRALISVLSHLAKLRADNRDGHGGDDGSYELIGILGDIKDESDRRKAVQLIWEGLRPVGLEADDTVDNLRTALKKSMDGILFAPLAIWNGSYQGFAMLIVLLLSTAIFVGVSSLSVIFAGISSDSVVLSNSVHAGLWVQNRESPGALLGDSYKIAYEKQWQAWNYRTNCYDKESEDDSDCNLFYSQRIEFESLHNAECPFDGNACALGPRGAFKVDTTLIDSNVLGINTPKGKRFWFQKTLTCAPLHADERYVQSEGQALFPRMWEYYYGAYLSSNRSDPVSNQTFTNPGDWSVIGDWMPDYLLSFVYTDPAGKYAMFDPLPEFKAGNKTVTLTLLSTGGRYLHLHRRDDPMFPATTPTKAGVLGCVDWYQICTDATAKQCWDMVDAEKALDEFENDKVRQQALYLVLVGLKDSFVWHTINYRRANILDATAKIAQVIGVGLAKNQWQVEVDNMFKGSLAYIQVRVFDFARGTYAGRDMIDITDSRLRAVDVGRMYKFRDPKFINVDAFGIWGGMCLCIVLITGSLRFSNAKRAQRATERGNCGYHNALWIYIALHSLLRLFRWHFDRLWSLRFRSTIPQESEAAGELNGGARTLEEESRNDGSIMNENASGMNRELEDGRTA